MLGVAQEIKEGANLATLKPLQIRPLKEVSAAQLTTYKPAYDPVTAKNALDTTGVFEGPISLFALDPSLVDRNMDPAVIAALVTNIGCKWPQEGCT